MYAGIDIGGTNIKVVLTDISGRLIASGSTTTPDTSRKIDAAIKSIIEKIAENVNTHESGIKAIGIGAAGSIDRKRGLVISSPNVLCWENYPLAPKIEKLTGIRTFLENDASVACAGFWWSGRGKYLKNFVMVTLGTGIGGGAVIDGKLFTGQNGSSLEIGHITVDINGRECPCGNRGCLEQYASATALVRFVKENLKKFKGSSLQQRLSGSSLTAKMIYEEALRGDELSLQAFEEISRYLGTGIASIVNILNPEAVILGGGLSGASKLIIPIVKKTVAERAMKGFKEKLKITAVTKQDILPAMGAARIARDRLSDTV